jgi:hypothetical protein
MRRLLSLEDPLAQLIALAIWRLRDWRYWLYCSWRASHRTTTAWRNGVTRCTRCGRTWQR